MSHSVNLASEKNEEKKTKKNLLPMSRGFKIALAIFAILVVGSGLAVGYFALTKATIKITLQPAAYLAQSTYSFTPGIDQPDVPGRLMELKLSKTLTVNASFDTQPADKAGGIIKIINTSKSAQPLVATTRFQSADGKIFRTKKRVSVPAGGSVSAEVEADVAGPVGNGSAGKYILPALAKSRQAEIYGETALALTQANRKIPKVAPADLDNAKSSIQTALSKDLITAFKGQLKFGEELRTESIISQITNISAKVKVGDTVPSFEATGELLARAIAVMPAKFIQTITDIVKNAADKDDREFVSLNPTSLRLTLAPDANNPANLIATLLASASTFMTIDNPALSKEKMLGRSEEELRNYLATFPDVADVKLDLTPFWAKRIPTFEGNINLSIEKTQNPTPVNTDKK
ncbi:MAG: hypothetical protein UW34_C0011G0005 [Parcubacteria group bacterium GW2011_GWA2_44_15]|nr:MAG: hypothetical protein UW34_C0011G0005 [Parcubacteria group bacterium GW2011_GWA2_44_15]